MPRNKASCQDLVDQTVKQHGRIDVLINNAGVITRGNILETSDEDWDLTLDVNVSAIFLTCRAAIKHMRAQGSGAIVNVSSTLGLFPSPGRDYARDGIRIDAVCPNEVNTPMLRNGFAKRGFDPDQAIEQLNDSVPLGRIAEPEDGGRTKKLPLPEA